MSVVTRCGATLSATILAVSGLALTASSASAAPRAAAVSSCKASPSDATCDGMDPQTTGCAADAYTVPGGTAKGPGGTVELRYSPSCKTNWARVQNAQLNLTLFVIRQDGAERDSVEFLWASGTVWSPMLYSPVMKAQAGYNWDCCDSGGGIRTPLK
jgi:hypothetical protein